MQAGVPDRLHERVDHVAARGDREDVDLRIAVGALAAADHPVVEDGLVERHRDLVLRAEANRRVELLRVLDPRQPQRANHDALVGDPEANRLGELVPREEILEGLAERGGVLDLALAHDSGLERHDRGASDGTVATSRDLGRGDAAGLDVEADEGGCSSSQRASLEASLPHHLPSAAIGPMRHTQD